VLDISEEGAKAIEAMFNQVIEEIAYKSLNNRYPDYR